MVGLIILLFAWFMVGLSIGIRQNRLDLAKRDSSGDSRLERNDQANRRRGLNPFPMLALSVALMLALNGCGSMSPATHAQLESFAIEIAKRIVSEGITLGVDAIRDAEGHKIPTTGAAISSGGAS